MTHSIWFIRSGRMEDADKPLKDYGSFVHVQPSEADIAGMIIAATALMGISRV